MSQLLIAPPAQSVQLLARQFGAASCGIRFSSHSFSGLVVVVRFAQCSQAYAFARLASRLAGYRCTVRGPQGVVSVPVAPASPLLPRSVPPAPVRPVAPAVVFVAPAAAPGGKCIAYLASGQPCQRKATRGHYCGTHARQVM